MKRKRLEFGLFQRMKTLAETVESQVSTATLVKS